MAKTNKGVRFNGSKLRLEQSVSASAAITAVTATNPATVTGVSAVKGDIIRIEGLDGFNGDYVVESVASGKVTLANTDWTGKTVPASYTNAKSYVVKFSDAFCLLKNVQKSGSTVEQIDVTTICDTNGKVYEAGDREEGNLTLQFMMKPSNAIQQMLEDYEFNGEKFWCRLELANNQGSYLFYGFIETGLNMDGSVGQNWESGIGIKLVGRRYLISTGA